MFRREDETDLLLPLMEGVDETPAFSTFVARLRQRLKTGYVAISVTETDVDAQGAEAIEVQLPRLTAHELRTLLTGDSRRLSALRTGRLYGLAELVPEHPEPDARRALRRWRDVRLARVAPSDGPSATLLIADERADYDAGIVGLIAGLIPHLEAALRLRRLLRRERARAAVSARALAATGVGWVALDAGGAVTDLDPVAATLLALPGRAPPGPGQRLAAAAPGAQRALAETLEGFATAPDMPRRLLLLSTDPRRAMLLFPAPRTAPGGAVALGLVRASASAVGSGGRDALIAEEFGLARGEARVADALARGATIAQAAATGGLTLETARHYTKRAYEKTGTHGQASLVGRILSSVSALGGN